MYAVGGINDIEIKSHGHVQQPMTVHCGSQYTAHCLIDPLSNKCALRNHVCNTNVAALLNITAKNETKGTILGDRVIMDGNEVDLLDPAVNTINIHKHVTSTYNSVYSWTMKHKVLMTALASWCVFCLLTCGVVCYYGKKRRSRDRMMEDDKNVSMPFNSDDTAYEGHSILDENQPDEGTGNDDDDDVNLDEYDSGSVQLEIMNKVKKNRGRM